MAIRNGLEPSTSSVTGWHSNQLNYRTAWWEQQGSNLWPSACKADALPAELCSHPLCRSSSDFHIILNWVSFVNPFFKLFLTIYNTLFFQHIHANSNGFIRLLRVRCWKIFRSALSYIRIRSVQSIFGVGSIPHRMKAACGRSFICLERLSRSLWKYDWFFFY